MMTSREFLITVARRVDEDLKEKDTQRVTVAKKSMKKDITI